MGEPERSRVCNTMAISGVGLLGGSLGMAVRARGLARRVIGAGRDAGRLRHAQKLGAIDSHTLDLEEACAQADLIVLCGPVSTILDQVLPAIAAAPAGAVVTDVGSTKNTIVKMAERSERTDVIFVGSHPIAGSEKSGVDHARPDLFQGATVVLTPDHHVTDEAIARVRALWRAVGMRIVEVLPTRHDQLLAMVSHLPHLVAAALADHVKHAPPNSYDQLRQIAGPGFRDTTRIAEGNPEVWEDIFLQNAEDVLKAMDIFLEVLYRARAALLHTDGRALREILTEAALARRDFGCAGDEAFPRESAS